MRFFLVPMLLGCLLFSVAAFARAEPSTMRPFFASWLEFRRHAIETASSRAVGEMNRALAELRLRHGKLRLDMDPAEAVRQLVAEGYMKLDLPWSQELDPVRIVEGLRFESLAHGGISASERSVEVGVENAYLKRALLDEDPRLRWFVLAQLRTRPHESPVKFVLRGFLRERRLDLVQSYVQLLKTERFIRAAERIEKIPGSLEKRIRAYARAARTPDQRAQALFLAIMFTEHRPEVDLPLLVHSIDMDFAFPYLLRLFKAYPPRWIEAFARPLKMGFGDRHELLMELFTHFQDRYPCMQALAFAFVNRRKRHFALLEPAIVRIWEKMSGLSHEGSDRPFLEWYHARKPPKP